MTTESKITENIDAFIEGQRMCQSAEMSDGPKKQSLKQVKINEQLLHK